MTDTLRYHRQTALAYIGLGVLVILITFAAGLVPAAVESRLLEFSIGAIFVLIFGALIYRGWWLISALLVFSNTWRVVTYFNDGIGLHIELRSFSITEIEPSPVAFVNAAERLPSDVSPPLQRLYRGWCIVFIRTTPGKKDMLKLHPPS